MKRLFIILAIFLMAVNMMAQESDIPPVYPYESGARYRLFPTRNMYNFLELDTRTGKINQVQWSTKGDSYRFTTSLNNDVLVWSWDTLVDGRFTLYPTSNMYNFVMLDQIDGRTWQVQWNFEEENRGVMRIY